MLCTHRRTYRTQLNTGSSTECELCGSLPSCRYEVDKKCTLSLEGTGYFDTNCGEEPLGLRLGKTSGPLLDAGISIESVAFHVYAAITEGGAKSGGVQLQFSNLAVSTSGAQGDNGIAQGVESVSRSADRRERRTDAGRVHARR